MMEDPSGDYQLTFVAVDELAALQARLTDDVAQGLTKTVERYLYNAASDIKAAGQLGNDRYGLLHKSAFDPTRLQQAVEALTKAVDPNGEGVTLRSATMALDHSGLSGADSVSG